MSLVLGIISVVFLPVVLSAVAIVLGALALQDIKRQPGLRGTEQANWGIAIGTFTALVWIGVIAILAASAS